MPDELLVGHGTSADASAKAQCPWCLETLDGSELRAILPPALVLVGDHAYIGSGIANGNDWASGSDDFSALRTDHGGRTAAANHFQDADISLEEHAGHSHAYESEASEFDSVEIDPAHDDRTEMDVTPDRSEFAFQQSASERAAIDESAENPPQRVIKISVPGKAGAAGDMSAAMMDVDTSPGRRRNRKGSPLKTMIGVALGGLLALPIVGTILHFATGQYVPYISDILPGGGSAAVKTRANQPMMLDHSQPQIAEQPSQSTLGGPLEGQTIDDEFRDVPASSQLPDPADAALQAIVGGPSNLTTETLNNDPISTASETGLPQAASPDADLPVNDTTIPEWAEGNLDADDGLANNAVLNRSMDDETIPDDDLFGGDPFDGVVPTDPTFDSFDPTTMLSDVTATDSETEEVEQEDVIDFNDGNPLDATAADPVAANPVAANPIAASPIAASPVQPDAAPEAATEREAEDLFAGKTDIPSPTPVAPATPADEVTSLDIDAEVEQLTASLKQITGLATDDPLRAEQIQQFYEALSELAGSAPVGSAATLSPLIDQIAGNTSLVIAFAKATPAWVSRTSADRGSDGVVVVGKMSGEVTDATFTLLNRQELSVTLPAPLVEVPSGFQIGVGRISGSGPDAALTLELLQGIKQ